MLYTGFNVIAFWFLDYLLVLILCVGTYGPQKVVGIRVNTDCKIGNFSECHCYRQTLTFHRTQRIADCTVTVSACISCVAQANFGPEWSGDGGGGRGGGGGLESIPGHLCGLAPPQPLLLVHYTVYSQ